MSVLRYFIVLLLLGAASCAKQAKPTPPPAPVAETPDRVTLTVKVRVTKSDLKFTQEVFNRSRKQLKDLRGVFVLNTDNASMQGEVVSIDVRIPYKPGTSTNLNTYRYHINDRDAAAAAYSSPFAVQIKAADVTSNYTVVTPVYPVKWTHTNGGK